MSHSSICIVNTSDDNKLLNISFKYSSPPLLVNETLFRFSRKRDEQIGRTFMQIAQKINKTINKNVEKLKIKVTERIADQNIELKINGESVGKERTNSEVWIDGSHLIIDSFDYTICLNMPSIYSITLPNSIMNGFTVYPYLKLNLCEPNTCKYVWYKQKDRKNTNDSPSVSTESKNKKIDKLEVNEEWIEIGRHFYYNISSDDIGRKLKVVCFPSDGQKNGFEYETVSLYCVKAGPGLCPFEDRRYITRNNSAFGSFRIISYNILADLYADSDFIRKVLFPYCPQKALKIDFRKQLLIKELIGYNGDIYCLQEVDRKMFKLDLQYVLSLKNFGCIYSERTGQSVGLACFYDKSKFELCHTETVVLSDKIETNPIFTDLFERISSNEELLLTIKARTSLLQCVLLRSLECNDGNNAILLGNTHLYFHPNAANIRLIQSYVCVKYMEKEIAKYKESMPHLNISPILCGDFNSCPEFGVYRLITEKLVPKDINDWNSNTEECIEGIELTHSLRLSSAYGKPRYTNYTTDFNGCLDYIFYDLCSLTLEEVIPFPSHEQVTQNTAIPSIVFPSDHLALISTFKFT